MLVQPRQRLLTRLVHRQVDQQARAVARRRIPVHLLQAESPELRVVKMFNLVFHAAHLVALMPQRFKLRRGGEKARQFVFPRRIAAVLGHRGAEIGDEGRQHIAIFDPAAPGLMGQIEINAVAIFFREGGEIDAHQAAEAVVPRHNIKVRFLNAGRLRHQAVQHPAGPWADAFAHRHLGGFRRGQPGEHEQMPGLQRTALQGIRHPHQHRLRRIHLPPLLQPGVVNISAPKNYDILLT